MNTYKPFIRVLAVAVVTACAACSSVTPQPANRPAAHPADGAILERAACKVDTDPGAFAAAVNAYYLDDIVVAKLGPELAAKPLSKTFTYVENAQLADASRQGRCERIMYSSSGLRVAGYVLRPPSPGPHPVILWLRGGSREFGKIEQVTLLNLNWLANAGFIVIAPQYRGADGGEGADEFGGADVDDVMSLVPLARSLPGADLHRMYLLGGSRGAIQGTLAMRRGLPVRAAAFRGAVFDLRAMLAFRPYFREGWREMMPGFKDDPGAAMDRRSAILWPGELKAPVLMVHGRQDWRSQVEGVQAMDAGLARAGVPHKLVIYERDEHQLALHRTEWLNEVVAWFRQYGAFASH
jgi:dipeptidyl aminopeptidase/acylaminoacyl peptidase